MIHPKIFSTFILLSCSAGILSPELSGQNSSNSNANTIILVRTEKGKPIRRPKAPDRQIVTCAYDGEELHLSLVIPEGMATLSVTDETLLTSIYEFDTTSLEVSVPVGNLIGTISIEMETENNTYYGQIE